MEAVTNLNQGEKVKSCDLIGPTAHHFDTPPLIGQECPKRKIDPIALMDRIMKKRLGSENFVVESEEEGFSPSKRLKTDIEAKNVSQIPKNLIEESNENHGKDVCAADEVDGAFEPVLNSDRTDSRNVRNCSAHVQNSKPDMFNREVTLSREADTLFSINQTSCSDQDKIGNRPQSHYYSNMPHGKVEEVVSITKADGENVKDEHESHISNMISKDQNGVGQAKCETGKDIEEESQKSGVKNENGNVTSTHTQKSQSKRSSRKQNIPKRHVENLIDTAPNEISNFIDDIALPADGQTLDARQSDLCVGSLNTDQVSIEKGIRISSESNDSGVNANDNDVKTKAEKSRKQSKPKRIVHNDSETYQINDGNKEFDLDVQGDQNDNAGEGSVKEEENEFNYVFEGGFEALAKDDIGQELNGQILEKMKVADDNFDSETSSMANLYSSLLNSGAAFSVGSPQIGQNTAALMAENMDLLTKLSPSLLKTNSQTYPLSPDLTDISVDTELENLQVIRKLREFRSQKYRKISVAEKKEIAEYAKSNGITQAANVFSVSKSAVSMWCRQNLDELEENDEKRKRNCMLGNKKFESLCVKVRQQKEHKFRGLTKEDKFEVSKFAKLVGVREMARCLDVALGTVSGWMRQFPYVVKRVDEDSDGDFTCSNSVENENESRNESERRSEIESRNESESRSESERRSGSCGRSSRGNAVSNEWGIQNGNESRQEIGNKRGNTAGYHGEKHEERAIKEEKFDSEYGIEIEIVNDSWNEESEMEIKQERYEDMSETSTQIKHSSRSKRGKYKKHAKVINIHGIKGALQTVPVVEANESVTEVTEGGRFLFIRPKPKEMIEKEEMERKEQKDEIDKMIAVKQVEYKPPDIDQLYEEAQWLIEGTELDGNEDFKALFERVVKCKPWKYKTLTAEDKMAVCRYGKLVGVRKVGKILGLATGTLSGWNTKYHVYLTPSLENALNHSQNMSCVSSPGIDMDSSSLGMSSSFRDSDSSNDGSVAGTKLGNFNVSSTQSPSMAGKILPPTFVGVKESEISAIQCLFQDRFEDIKQKIEVARTKKFKNIMVEEKIEIVKCSKLVGIRPTARVLNIPIGTLSGWISKYSPDLHPAYNGGESSDDISLKIGEFPVLKGPLAIPFNPQIIGLLPGVTPFMTTGYTDLFPQSSEGNHCPSTSFQKESSPIESSS